MISKSVLDFAIGCISFIGPIGFGIGLLYSAAQWTMPELFEWGKSQGEQTSTVGESSFVGTEVQSDLSSGVGQWEAPYNSQSGPDLSKEISKPKIKKAPQVVPYQGL
jgi:hypothetical protein